MAQTRKKAEDFSRQKLYSAEKNPPAFGSSFSSLFSSRRGEKRKKKKHDTFVRSPSDWGKSPLLPTQTDRSEGLSNAALQRAVKNRTLIEKFRAAEAAAKRHRSSALTPSGEERLLFWEDLATSGAESNGTRTYGPGGLFGTRV